MKVWYEGKLIDTSVHKCATKPCVFCDSVNPEAAKHGLYAIPFDIPGVYDPNGEPNVIIIKLEDE